MGNIKYTTTNEFKSKVFFTNFPISLKDEKEKSFYSAEREREQKFRERIERVVREDVRESSCNDIWYLDIVKPEFYCSIYMMMLYDLILLHFCTKGTKKFMKKKLSGLLLRESFAS
jgi:benzoyl-CoA reductase/2-hydroxyglutaryl-CoA dehydratase subunit BcrC/BadD/HgdB